MYNIAKYINKSRYSTADKCIPRPQITEINRILCQNLSINLQPEMLHVDLGKLYGKRYKYINIKSSNRTIIILVYFRFTSYN